MTGLMTPITEADLHAFVDGQLDAVRRIEAEAYLARDADAAMRVAAWQQQRDTLRAAFASRLLQPVPASLNLHLLLRAQAQRRRSPWRVAAAVALAFAVGGGGGWFLRDATTPAPPGGLNVLAEEAVASHLVFSADVRRPVELWAAQRDDLTRWVSNRLNRPVAPPDLSAFGYRLMGGRLVATSHGAAALFMYENDGHARLSIFVRPMTNPQSVNKSTPFAQVDIGNVDGCVWIQKGVGYSVVGEAPYPLLLKLSQQAHDQIDRPS